MKLELDMKEMTTAIGNHFLAHNPGYRRATVELKWNTTGGPIHATVELHDMEPTDQQKGLPNG